MELTFRTIFWSLFGLKDAKTVELGEGYESRFTESVGYIVFGVYNWKAARVRVRLRLRLSCLECTTGQRFGLELGLGLDFGVYNWTAVIVLLNMLVAMMTRSFDKIAVTQIIRLQFTYVS